MALRHLWHLWPGRHWPSSADEESRFVADLADLAEGPRPPEVDRGDMTAVLNALRGGVSVKEVLHRLPGVRAHALLAAYHDLEALRGAAAAAWKAIEAEPTVTTLAVNSQLAAKLVPVAVYRISTASQISSHKLFVQAVAETSREMRRVTDQARLIEDELRRIEAPSARGVTLGRRLYDPYTPGLWGDPYFCPERVGALTPLRVRNLLNESRR